MRILVLEDDRVQQGRIEQTLLDIGRSRNLRLEIDIAKNYGDVEKYSQYFDHYQLYLLDLEIDGERERGFQVAQQVRGARSLYKYCLCVHTLGGLASSFSLSLVCLGFYFQGSARGRLPSSVGALSGLCTGSGQEGKYASLHL